MEAVVDLGRFVGVERIVDPGRDQEEACAAVSIGLDQADRARDLGRQHPLGDGWWRALAVENLAPAQVTGDRADRGDQPRRHA